MLKPEKYGLRLCEFGVNIEFICTDIYRRDK
jgi:hypothetical protein